MKEVNAVTEIPEICPRCGAIGTVAIITKTIGGVVKYYYKCSACNYQWAVPQQ